MSISIQISGDSHQEVLSELAGLAKGLVAPRKTTLDIVTEHIKAGVTGSGAIVGDTSDTSEAVTGEVSPPAVETVAKPRGGRRGSNKDKATDVVDLNAAVEKAADTGGANPPDAPVIGAADPIVEAQDKADEQAETVAQKDDGKPLTADDVRAAAQPYVTKFTMAHASEDLKAVLKEATGFEAISALMASTPSQETLKKAIAAFATAVATNPLKRAAVA